MTYTFYSLLAYVVACSLAIYFAGVASGYALRKTSAVAAEEPDK